MLFPTLKPICILQLNSKLPDEFSNSVLTFGEHESRARVYAKKSNSRLFRRLKCLITLRLSLVVALSSGLWAWLNFLVLPSTTWSKLFWLRFVFFCIYWLTAQGERIRGWDIYFRLFCSEVETIKWFWLVFCCCLSLSRSQSPIHWWVVDLGARWVHPRSQSRSPESRISRTQQKIWIWQALRFSVKTGLKLKNFSKIYLIGSCDSRGSEGRN